MTALSLSLGTRLEQRLLPRQIQFAALLQLPIQDLEQHVLNELEQNPFLEQAPSETVSLDQVDGSSERSSSYNGDDDGSRFEMFLADETSDMRARFIADFHFLHSSPNDQMIAETIIGNLDDDGYLRMSDEELIANIQRDFSLEITIADVEEVRKRIMHMDPGGIGARDIRESLIVQLHLRHEHSFSRKVAIDILEHHYDDFVKKHYEALEKKLEVDGEDIRKAYYLIAELNPKPGLALGNKETQQYVRPDITLELRDDTLEIIMNDGSLPRIRFCNTYSVSTKGGTEESEAFLREKQEAARVLVENIIRRKELLKKVVRILVARQEKFLRGEDEHARPLTYSDLAEETGVDETLLSRAVRGKYIQTPRGVKPLRSLFTESLTTAAGEEVATATVKARVRELIEAETKSKPLSDDRIADLLIAEGINIARRTVAKYREAMNIPVARMRRE